MKRIRIRSPALGERIISYEPPSFYDIIVFFELLNKNVVEAYDYILNKCIKDDGEKWELYWQRVVDVIITNSPFYTFESLQQQYDEITKKSESDEITARKLFIYKLALTLGRPIEEIKSWSEEEFIYFSYLATFGMMGGYENMEEMQTSPPSMNAVNRPVTYDELLADAIRSANIALAREIEQLRQRGIKFARTKEELEEVKKKYVYKPTHLDDYTHISSFLTEQDRDMYRAHLLRKRASALLRLKNRGAKKP